MLARELSGEQVALFEVHHDDLSEAMAQAADFIAEQEANESLRYPPLFSVTVENLYYEGTLDLYYQILIFVRT